MVHSVRNRAFRRCILFCLLMLWYPFETTQCVNLKRPPKLFRVGYGINSLRGIEYVVERKSKPYRGYKWQRSEKHEIWIRLEVIRENSTRLEKSTPGRQTFGWDMQTIHTHNNVHLIVWFTLCFYCTNFVSGLSRCMPSHEHDIYFRRLALNAKRTQSIMIRSFWGATMKLRHVSLSGKANSFARLHTSTFFSISILRFKHEDYMLRWGKEQRQHIV